MSNSTSPSTSADLAQGHVSKKSAGAEAPVSGLAKGPVIRSPSGGSISSGSTNNSGITKSTLNTNTINNPNSFSKTSTKDKDKTNSGRKGVTPSEGLDSQGGRGSSLARTNSLGSNDSRRLPSDPQGEELFATQGGHASPIENFDAPATDDYQSVQSSPALSSMTDNSSSQRGDKQTSMTSSSFKSQPKSLSSNPSSTGGPTSASNRDRSTSFEKRTSTISSGTRERNSANSNNRFTRGDQNQMHPQYHNQHPQPQQTNYMNYRQQRSGSQQGASGTPNMNNSSLQQQHVQMPQQWISYENVMYPNHSVMYNNAQQQSQIPQHQQNIAMLPHHQQAYVSDPRIQSYIGNPAGLNMVANMQTQYPAYYQQNRMPQYSYPHNNVQPGYGYVSTDQLAGTAHHQLYQQQHAIEMNAANMGIMGYAALPGGQYQYQVIQQQQYGNPAMVIPGTGSYNNSMGQPSPQHSQNGQFFNGNAPLDNAAFSNVQPSAANALNENAIAQDPNSTSNLAAADVPPNSDTPAQPSVESAAAAQTSVTDIDSTQADQVQASLIQPPPPLLHEKAAVEEPVVDLVKPRSLHTYKTKSGEVLDIGRFRKEANMAPSSESVNGSESGGSTANVNSVSVSETEEISNVKIESDIVDVNQNPEASVTESVAEAEAERSNVAENDTNDLATNLSNVASINSVSEGQSQSIPTEPSVVIANVPPVEPVVETLTSSSRYHPHPILTSDLDHSGLASSSHSSNTNSRNTSPRVSGLKADEVQDWRGSGRQLPPPAVPPTISTTRSKKSKKDLYAAADAKAAAGDSDLLSAYKDSPVVIPASLAPTCLEVADVTPSVEEPPAPELPDTWDEMVVPTLNLNTVAAKDSSAAVSVPFLATVTDGEDGTAKLVSSITDAPRRLRPGGTMGPKSAKSNTGASPLVYSREEILNFKPPNLPLSSTIPCYSSPIMAVQYDGGGGGGGGSPYVKGQGPTVQTQAPYQPARGGLGQQQHAYYPAPAPPSHANKDPSESGGWERKGLPPPASASQQPTYSQSPTAQQQAPVKQKIPLAKKITDPMELLSIEVKSILNKITPQTFEKLSVQMLTLDVSNTAMLDKVIGIIFDKALDEPYFTQLYAELCGYFNKEGTKWVFYTIVKYLDENMYFWIKDFAFDRSVAGPYSSDKECIDAVLDAEVPPPMNLPTIPLENIDIILTRDMLMKIYVQEATKQYYVTYVPFSEVDSDKRCMTLEGNIEKVRKDARNNNNFRSRLVNKCQAEFEKTTLNEKVYAELEQSKQQLLTQKDSLSASEYALQEADITEKQGKIKRRMLGNIRFVGELYKKGLISTKVMDSCISVLLGSPDSWKEMKDEQDIELLCKLLTTIGQTFEEKSNSEQSRNFDAYFDRMQRLSKDKSLNSRMRFTIEEVIFLRKNKWQARREQEGPLKISEIHQKIQEEEERTKQAAMMSGGIKQPALGPGSMPPDNSRNMDYRRVNSDASGGQRRLTPGQTAPPSYDISRLTTGSQHGSIAMHQQPQYSPALHAHIQSLPLSSPKLQFDDDNTLKRVKGIIQEFLSNGDLTEIRLSIGEAKNQLFGGYFVKQILLKAIDSNQLMICKQLVQLFRDVAVASYISNCKAEVEAVVRGMECIKMLVDTTVDCSNAPEIVGTILRSLAVETTAISFNKVYTIIEEFRDFNLKEESYDAEVVHKDFERFLAAVNQTR
eukprot:gene22184-30424_t